MNISSFADQRLKTLSHISKIDHVQIVRETRGRFRTNQRVAKVMGRGSHEIGLIAEDVRLVYVDASLPE